MAEPAIKIAALLEFAKWLTKGKDVFTSGNNRDTREIIATGNANGYVFGGVERLTTVGLPKSFWMALFKDELSAEMMDSLTDMIYNKEAVITILSAMCQMFTKLLSSEFGIDSTTQFAKSNRLGRYAFDIEAAGKVTHVDYTKWSASESVNYLVSSAATIRQFSIGTPSINVDTAFLNKVMPVITEKGGVGCAVHDFMTWSESKIMADAIDHISKQYAIWLGDKDMITDFVDMSYLFDKFDKTHITPFDVMVRTTFMVKESLNVIEDPNNHWTLERLRFIYDSNEFLITSGWVDPSHEVRILSYTTMEAYQIIWDIMSGKVESVTKFPLLNTALKYVTQAMTTQSFISASPLELAIAQLGNVCTEGHTNSNFAGGPRRYIGTVLASTGDKAKCAPMRASTSDSITLLDGSSVKVPHNKLAAENIETIYIAMHKVSWIRTAGAVQSMSLFNSYPMKYVDMGRKDGFKSLTIRLTPSAALRINKHLTPYGQAAVANSAMGYDAGRSSRSLMGIAALTGKIKGLDHIAQSRDQIAANPIFFGLFREYVLRYAPDFHGLSAEHELVVKSALQGTPVTSMWIDEFSAQSPMNQDAINEGFAMLVIMRPSFSTTSWFYERAESSDSIIFAKLAAKARENYASRTVDLEEWVVKAIIASAGFGTLKGDDTEKAKTLDSLGFKALTAPTVETTYFSAPADDEEEKGKEDKAPILKIATPALITDTPAVDPSPIAMTDELTDIITVIEPNTIHD